MIVRKLRHIPIEPIRRWLRIDVRKWLCWNKQVLVMGLFYVAMLLAFFSSMHVSFLWRIENFCPLLEAAACCMALLLGNSMMVSPFSRRDFLIPALLAAAVLFFQRFTLDSHLIQYMMCIFHSLVFLTLLRLDTRYLADLGTLLAKTLAVLVALSLMFFFLYLSGFNLPHHAVDYQLYYYEKYPFFLLDDRNLFVILPRFHAFFLEPGHMGTVIVLLLAAQKGQWKRWYNVILIIALLLSFSLAAYGLLVITIILHMWIDRKHIVGKLIILTLIIGGAVGASFLYNQGDNMLNQAIVSRLEVNETGDGIEGNNRVSDSFKAEFDSYMHSADILFGRDMPKDEFGNAGYRVYIYEHGIIGFLLTYLFYFFAMYKGPNKRAFIAMIALSLANFWIRAYPMWYGFFIPYYLMAYIPQQTTIREKGGGK